MDLMDLKLLFFVFFFLTPIIIFLLIPLGELSMAATLGEIELLLKSSCDETDPQTRLCLILANVRSPEGDILVLSNAFKLSSFRLKFLVLIIVFPLFLIKSLQRILDILDPQRNVDLHVH